MWLSSIVLLWGTFCRFLPLCSQFVCSALHRSKSCSGAAAHAAESRGRRFRCICWPDSEHRSWWTRHSPRRTDAQTAESCGDARPSPAASVQPAITNVIISHQNFLSSWGHLQTTIMFFFFGCTSSHIKFVLWNEICDKQHSTYFLSKNLSRLSDFFNHKTLHELFINRVLPRTCRLYADDWGVDRPGWGLSPGGCPAPAWWSWWCVRPAGCSGAGEASPGLWRPAGQHRHLCFHSSELRSEPGQTHRHWRAGGWWRCPLLCSWSLSSERLAFPRHPQPEEEDGRWSEFTVDTWERVCWQGFKLRWKMEVHTFFQISQFYPILNGCLDVFQSEFRPSQHCSCQGPQWQSMKRRRWQIFSLSMTGSQCCLWHGRPQHNTGPTGKLGGLHIWADDNDLEPLNIYIYIAISPGDYRPIQTLNRCIEQTNDWMCQSFFQLNND